MDLHRIASLLAVLALVGCVSGVDTEPGYEVGVDESAVQVEKCKLPPGDPCQPIPTAFDEILFHIDAAIVAIDADVAAHGPDATPPGEYAIAPVYSRAALDAARSSLLGGESFADAAPGPGGYAHAYQLHAGTPEIWSQLWHAGHWATISVAYHGGEDARVAYAHTASARLLTSQLSTLSATCYANAVP